MSKVLTKIRNFQAWNDAKKLGGEVNVSTRDYEAFMKSAPESGKNYQADLAEQFAKKGIEVPYVEAYDPITIAQARKSAAEMGEVFWTPVDAIIAEKGITLRTKASAFVQSETMRVMFAEWISMNLASLALESSVASRLVPDLEIVDTNNYTTHTLEDNVDHDILTEIGIGSDFPEISYKAGDTNLQLAKYGARLTVPYELMKFRTVFDFRQTYLAYAAKKIQLGIDYHTIYTLLNGDGVTDGLAAGNTIETAGAGTITASDLVRLSLATNSTWPLDTFVGSDTICALWGIANLDIHTDKQQEAFQWGLPKLLRYNHCSTLLGNYAIGCAPGAATRVMVTEQPMEESFNIYKNQTLAVNLYMYFKIVIKAQAGIGALKIKS